MHILDVSGGLVNAVLVTIRIKASLPLIVPVFEIGLSLKYLGKLELQFGLFLVLAHHEKERSFV